MTGLQLWAVLPLALVGIGLVFAPVIGGWLAARDVWTHCPRCGRELIGYPPEHREGDRGWCRLLAEMGWKHRPRGS